MDKEKTAVLTMNPDLAANIISVGKKAIIV